MTAATTVRAIATQPVEVIGQWVAARTGGTWTPGRGTAIALAEDGTIIAGVLYEDFNGANMLVHIAADASSNWATCREYLWFIFYYPFQQMACRRITALVASGNKVSQAFVKRLGFKLEATLKDAHPDGALLVFAMHRQECRWLNLRRKQNG